MFAFGGNFFVCVTYGGAIYEKQLRIPCIWIIFSLMRNTKYSLIIMCEKEKILTTRYNLTKSFLIFIIISFKLNTVNRV